MDSNPSYANMDGILDGKVFERLSAEIHKRFGIVLPITRKGLLTARVQQRMLVLGLLLLEDYLERLFERGENGDREFILLLDSVTSPKIEFFDNPRQLEFLAQEALPELIKMHGAGVSRMLNIWSAGCATGEDPYTLTMVLKEFGEHYPGIQFQSQILATDVSPRIIEFAQTAIYEMEKVQSLPVAMKKKYLLRSRDQRKGQVKIVSELRSMVRFRLLDFMDPAFGLREKMDIIFCRNILSYFDRSTQEKLVNKLCHHLTPGGYLFVGASESLQSLSTPLNPIAHAVYRLAF